MDKAEIAVAVTTYKKNAALEGFLDSLGNFGKVGAVCICDDGAGEALAVAQKYEKDFFCSVSYYTGEQRVGIAKNKNRGIKWFLESEEAKDLPYLVLCDDDIKFKKFKPVEPFNHPLKDSETIGEALINASKAAGVPHITGYLGDYTDPLSGNSFFSVKPMIAQDEYLYHYQMSQGILLFATREVVNNVGYFNINWTGPYGYEHSSWSARINRWLGRNPELFPILKRCYRYFQCQSIPNNYTDAKPELNAAQYQQSLLQTYAGLNISQKQPGV